ncbi:hypothetical protein K8R66_04415 [bacterium]|nr:hypothetical protein [bacterium]
MLVIVSIIISGCSIQDTTTNNNKDADVDLSSNFSYCQTDDDCVAVSNPSNGCYFGYFNKNASKAIEEFENNLRMMKQDCPKFGKVYCKNNKCVADRK